MKYVILLILICLYYCREVCKLIQGYPVNVNQNKIIKKYLIIQPFPNLKKCYKHNEEACCNIINDGVISEYIESYIPEDCLRIFPELEDLLCFGCSANEAKYRSEDNDNKVIRVCKSFAKKIWKVDNDADLNKPSTRFDGCGLLAEENNFAELLESEGDEDEDINYIIPSKEFASFSEFINALKIPYYKDYTIEVVDGDENSCFNSNNFIKYNTFTKILISLIPILALF